MERKITLKKLLEKDGIVVAPGCHDALGAKIIEQVGFNAAYMTGNGTCASLLGKPDIGLVTMTEMINHARGIVSAVNIPVICDADTGYGNVNNVVRTVQEYEAAGVSAIHIEDQITPKKCGAMQGLSFISKEEHAEKIRTAVKTRKDPNFLIIARTDSRRDFGLDEAIARGKACLDAGADLIYLENLESVEEMKRVTHSIDAPLVYDSIENSGLPYLTTKQLEDIGYKLVIHCLSSTFAYAYMMKDLMKHLKEDGSTKKYLPKMMKLHDDYEGLLGLNNFK